MAPAADGIDVRTTATGRRSRAMALLAFSATAASAADRLRCGEARLHQVRTAAEVVAAAPVIETYGAGLAAAVSPRDACAAAAAAAKGAERGTAAAGRRMAAVVGVAWSVGAAAP